MSDPEIVALDGDAAAAALDELAAVLEDCVAGGASVNFMPPFSRADAAAFFRGVVEEVARGDIVLLVARDGGRIIGTVQLGLATVPNQRHRADVKKMLVHRSARNRGIAAALMRHVEDEARARERTLLVLDTCVGSEAERLYVRAGWNRAGVVPGYALWPDGRPCDAAFFWKRV
ncbi:MAG TPA: GNAT family N-acetyltransferase [Pseudolabrys sp.]|nr:GNAT family N-acetyltransferase [Pseudolabrys sp.]